MDLYPEAGKVTPLLRTARLQLRPVQAADDAAIVAALADWGVSLWLTAVPYPYTADDAIFFRTQIASDADMPHWTLDAGAGLIGMISVMPDLGYGLAAAQHGQGYMTEAVDAVLAWYFANNDTPLASGYLPGNAASHAILHKVGFTDAAQEKVMQTATGRHVYVQKMTLTQADWQVRHA